MYQLSDVTRVKALKMLTGMIPGQADIWMDDVRSQPAYKYTAPWHYTNIEPGESYKPEEYLSGKTICVTGKVIDYKGRPEIIVDKEDQITVQ